MAECTGYVVLRRGEGFKARIWRQIGNFWSHFCPSSHCLASQLVSFAETNEKQHWKYSTVGHEWRRTGIVEYLEHIWQRIFCAKYEPYIHIVHVLVKEYYSMRVTTSMCTQDNVQWKEVPAAQVSCGPAFNQLDSAHHPTMGGGGASAKYGGAISQVWGGPSAKYGGGHQPTMGGAISQVWGGHQPTMGGAISQVWGGGVFSHQYVQEVKLQRITLATHTSCRL